MAEKKKKSQSKPVGKPTGKTRSPALSASSRKFLLPVLAFTFLLFLPALQNGFTNWDDILYVTGNPLLKNLNAEGLKAIFDTPVVSNYHPLTILSLAVNYQIAKLSPMTWHLTSIILHTINTGLVFWFIMILSGSNKWVSAIVALLFGIHPMHVESVAWISERKDLLYTLFYLGAMIVYTRYIRRPHIKWMAITTLLGALSLLSKPAAIVLPLSLLLLDYYLKRTWSLKWIIEKIPLLLLSGVIAYVTVAIQAKRAIASVATYDFIERICFAGFGWMWYLLKIIVPYPLSGLHPFPKDLTLWYYLATLASVLAVGYIAVKVRNRLVLFGIGFYTVNLLLVLQLVSIGNAVVAERYTYVPYIGLFFIAAMTGYKWATGSMIRYKNLFVAAACLFIVAMSVLTFRQIGVWKNSQTLWQNIVTHYPQSARAWTNKALDFYEQQKMPEAIDHLSRALAVDSLHADAREWRGRAYLDTKDFEKALQDALIYNKYFPKKEAGMFILARAYDANQQSENAVALYQELISMNPKPEYYNNRGVILFNRLRQYDSAKRDFEKAIQLDPDNGSFYLNLSRCYYMAGDLESARKFATKGAELGATVDKSYAQLIGFQ
jgi:tetratricopeptide (TPR) repeat protein